MSRTTHPTRSIRAAYATLAVVAAIGLPAPARAAAGPEIPARPEQLQFPVRRYEPPRAADARVRLSNGMVAYLVADRSLPIVTVNVLMRIGPDLDPPGREGLAQGMVYLLTRGGTASRGAKQVEDRVAFLGAQLESQMGGGGGGMFGAGAVPIGPSESRATLNLLSKDLDEGLGLLVECLGRPAFEAERLKLWKDQQLQAMKQRNDESASIEEREWAFLMRGDGHWSTRYPTAASLEAVTRDDLAAFHRRYVGPKNFILSVSGDFDRAAMVRALEKAFAKWPGAAERPGPPPAPAAPAASGWFMVDKNVNQGRVSIGLRAIDRYDPDYQAARVMNDILGGGGFSSRLVNRIRSDEGLAYSVGSQLQGGTYYPDAWRIGFQTKVRSVAFAIQIALGEVQRIRDSLVTPGELEVTKNKFIEALPAQFETAASIANALAVEELTGRYLRDPGYYAEYRERVGRVTAADVQRVARRLLEPSKLAVLVVGNADDMLLGDPKRDARLTALAGGEPRRLPLRDPLTMKPISSP
jgi:predicted Zn-dependent peptidase